MAMFSNFQDVVGTKSETYQICRRKDHRRRIDKRERSSFPLCRWERSRINRGGRALGPVDNYLSQTIMQAMQIMDMKAWAVLS